MPRLPEHHPAPLRGLRRKRQGQGARLTGTEDAGSQVEGRLAVREDEAAFLVVRADDPADWLVRFDKSGDFPAREWAENMVRVYNRRLSQRTAGPPTPPGNRPDSYHPDR